MKTIRNLAVTFTLLGAAALAHAQINMPNPTDPGSSIITAVRRHTTSSRAARAAGPTGPSSG